MSKTETLERPLHAGLAELTGKVDRLGKYQQELQDGFAAAVDAVDAAENRLHDELRRLATEENKTASPQSRKLTEAVKKAETERDGKQWQRMYDAAGDDRYDAQRECRKYVNENLDGLLAEIAPDVEAVRERFAHAIEAWDQAVAARQEVHNHVTRGLLAFADKIDGQSVPPVDFRPPAIQQTEVGHFGHVRSVSAEEMHAPLPTRVDLANRAHALSGEGWAVEDGSTLSSRPVWP